MTYPTHCTITKPSRRPRAAGQLANIESITAVVIGVISLFGGRGSILGTLFGALIVGVFTLGLRLLGADAQWTYLLIGVLIIGAVALDQRIRRATV
ncbi:ABC transporter permease subunit [Halomonas sp. GXIMD04776]|uniref:ABC transporter permease subunit n=1 Tax=Halomonas sp. GXIMD04776 TaxID=3415605 RepID=UPI003C84CB6B